MNPKAHVLTNDEIQKAAPAVFADHAHARVSDRYEFIPTVGVIDLLRAEGWFPVKVIQARVRQQDRFGYQKHLIRFRRDGLDAKLGDSIPELLLSNAHDASAAYRLEAGIWRLVCSNGLVIADSIFQKISVRHVGFKAQGITDASYKLLRELPAITASVNGMKAVTLSRQDALTFAEKALVLRWSGDQPAPITPDQLLTARRYDDRGDSLWLTFQRVQENLLKGGLRGLTSNMRRTRTRAVSSITEDVRLNKALWELAEQYRQAKAPTALRLAA